MPPAFDNLSPPLEWNDNRNLQIEGDTCCHIQRVDICWDFFLGGGIPFYKHSSLEDKYLGYYMHIAMYNESAQNISTVSATEVGRDCRHLMSSYEIETLFL